MISFLVHRKFIANTFSAGFGIAVQFSIARLELNYVMPFMSSTQDAQKPGLSFGFGVSFL